METILNLTYLYLLVILLALLIERVMEVIMVCWNLFELKLNSHHYWNRRTKRLMDKFSSEVQSRFASTSFTLLGINRRIKHYTETEDEIIPGRTVVFSSKAVRHVFVRTFAFIVTSVLGVLLCYFAEINVIELVREALQPNAIPLLDSLGSPLELIISGLMIGLGAEPMHRVIKGLEDSRAWLERRNRLNNTLIDAAEAKLRG